MRCVLLFSTSSRKTSRNQEKLVFDVLDWLPHPLGTSHLALPWEMATNTGNNSSEWAKKRRRRRDALANFEKLFCKVAAIQCSK